jgi:RsiW-degrading membrane proteinase PrsW (M82 family)
LINMKSFKSILFEFIFGSIVLFSIAILFIMTFVMLDHSRLPDDMVIKIFTAGFVLLIVLLSILRFPARHFYMKWMNK